MKTTLTIGAGLIVVSTIAFFVIKPNDTNELPTPTGPALQNTPQTKDENARVVRPATQTGDGTTKLPQAPSLKLKADTFTGTLEKVDTGCFADGECFIEVDGKHVTVLFGWNQEEVGSVLGVEGFGDLENYVGKEVEVYAQDKTDGKYTLYGSSGFYVKVLD